MIYAYNNGSVGAKELSAALGMKLISHTNSKYKGSKDKLVINWGSSNLPEEVSKSMIINNEEAVKKAVDKKVFFETVKDEVSIPEFTFDHDQAQSWVDKGSVVFGRKSLTGSGGTDIIIYESGDHVDGDPVFGHQVKMYTKYIPKKDEYRVHVVFGEVIDARRKALKSDYKGKQNWKIRNHMNGFIFQKDGFELPGPVAEQAIKAVKACGLDFGAVDVIWNELRNQAYVLEVNTAPGLEGSTIDSYKEAFDSMYDAWKHTNKKEEEKDVIYESLLKEIFNNKKQPKVKHFYDVLPEQVNGVVIDEWQVELLEPQEDDEEEDF